MSFRKKGRKFRPVSGKTFPSSSGTVPESEVYNFTAVIAETLRHAFGGTARSVKTVMGYTGAGERTVKNWFQAKNGPNGANLIELVRHSDEVLEAVLFLSGRKEILMVKMLADTRSAVVEMLEIMDQLPTNDPPGQSSSD